MSIRSSVPAGSWTQVATGPATVQLISGEATGVEVMVYAGASQPATNFDGFVLNSAFPSHTFTQSTAIWAQAVQANLTALVAAQ